MVENRSVLVLYLTATCNLKCTYCYIDKSPALQDIDNILDESFSTSYYYDFAKEMFPEPGQLTEIQFWGGEPSIGMHRFYNLLPSFVNHFYNLSDFMMSTNFTPDNWFDEFYGFTSILGRFQNRKFNFTLQLSIDGPEYINDENRGIGTTKKFLQSFNKLLETLDDNLPKNVNLKVSFKPTYTSDTINKLQTEERIIEYFQFFDKLVADLKRVKKANVDVYQPIPNTAVPSPHTKEDGIKFANYCKLTRKIEKDNENKHYFQTYTEISSFQPQENSKRKQFNTTYKGICGNCGSGRCVVGLLPDRRVSACHGGFTELLEEYNKNCEINKNWDRRSILNNLFTNNGDTLNMCMTLNEYEKYEKMIDCYYDPDCTFQKLNLVTLIRLLAQQKQIDEKYIDEKLAIEAALYLLESTSYCVRNNLAVTGSISLYPVGLIKLLLNGAKDYLEQ